MAEMTSDFVRCIRVEDIPEGSIIAVNVEGHSIALTVVRERSVPWTIVVHTWGIP